ncbi:hypothetical protein BZG36_05553 [Bifiguratus adelaidae]|uniref:G-protein coupled receptors family 2 profile 2 domain-containing protein n=1 Tax=Bifiguratus adelaidae TaxID=1938954 RepID=A0A261XT54_9FUNG|nr:hypothetical protein BZG36_05553 [Bifiguratus adelaidae]
MVSYLNVTDSYGHLVPDLSFPYAWQAESIVRINDGINAASIVCAVLVLLVIFCVWLYNRKLVDRVSLRLSAAISATDLVNSAAIIIYSNVSAAGGVCKLAPFLIVWLTNQYILFTVAIAFNLQYLFLNERPFNPYFEKYYYIFAIGLSLLTAILPLAADRFGFDEAQQYCWFKESHTFVSQAWEYLTYLIPELVATAYCLIVVGTVVFRLKRESKELDRQISQGRQAAMNASAQQGSTDWVAMPEPVLRRQRTRKAINQVVRRILLYPLVPLVTQIGFIVSEMWMYHNLAISYPLNVWGVALSATPGICNFLAFCIDPAMYNAMAAIKTDLIAKYGDESTDSSPGLYTISTKPSRPSTSIQPNHPSQPPTGPFTGLMRFIVRTFFTKSSQRGAAAFFMMSSSEKQTDGRKSSFSDPLQHIAMTDLQDGGHEIVEIPEVKRPYPASGFASDERYDWKDVPDVNPPKFPGTILNDPTYSEHDRHVHHTYFGSQRPSHTRFNDSVRPPSPTASMPQSFESTDRIVRSERQDRAERRAARTFMTGL